jgi:hypothetical protein
MRITEYGVRVPGRAFIRLGVGLMFPILTADRTTMSFFQARGLANVSYPYIVTNDVFESVLMPFIQG